MRHYLDARAPSGEDHAGRVRRWIELVYAGDISGTTNRAHPRVAARMLSENPDLVAGNPYLACVIGDEQALRQATAEDSSWLNRPGGPLQLPPLVAITQSSLLNIAEFREPLLRSARLLLQAGADPNQHVSSRWTPGTLREPDERYRLTALYGAAGQNHDIELTRLLLEAGADPNDGESLYHSVEGSSELTGLLLASGARVTGSNAIYRAIDFDNAAALELLLRHGGDPNEPATNKPITDWPSPLLWAIRRRALRCIQLLLDAGASPETTTATGVSAYRLALQFGLADAADRLRAISTPDPLIDEERFIAACARGDEAEAQRIGAERPDLPAGLTPQQLQLLPEMAASGADVGVRLMVKLGWPITVRGGDWDASALNHAVFRGDAALARYLLEHGASWTEQHGFGDNVVGSLSWASCNRPVDRGDWAGCAQALLDHGMPRGIPDPEDPEWILIDGRKKQFSDEVSEVLLGETT